MAFPKFPTMHQALVLNSTKNPYDILVNLRETPRTEPGGVIIRVLASSVSTYADRVYSGQKRSQYPDPFVSGSAAIGRVVMVGAGFDESSNKLMERAWRDGTYTEYSKVPLENCFPLDEARWMGDPSQCGLGYTTKDLMYFWQLSVPFGGLQDVEVKAGRKGIISTSSWHLWQCCSPRRIRTWGQSRRCRS
ncbi:hypothetical protein F5Y15DRAFT_396425 [Xylariaceae sp. FL0016]|nr:hypothetical protein F5Y15DRAFT_396425 [Xylariaceae sp. FL0016]